MARRRLKWIAKQLDRLSKVIAVLAELEDYKPLMLRQIYYYKEEMDELRSLKQRIMRIVR